MHAVASLRRLFGQRPYKAMLERFAWHDWQAPDPTDGLGAAVGGEAGAAHAVRQPA